MLKVLAVQCHTIHYSGLRDSPKWLRHIVPTSSKPIKTLFQFAHTEMRISVSTQYSHFYQLTTKQINRTGTESPFLPKKNNFRIRCKKKIYIFNKVAEEWKCSDLPRQVNRHKFNNISNSLQIFERINKFHIKAKQKSSWKLRCWSDKMFLCVHCKWMWLPWGGIEITFLNKFSSQNEFLSVTLLPNNVEDNNWLNAFQESMFDTKYMIGFMVLLAYPNHVILCCTNHSWESCRSHRPVMKMVRNRKQMYPQW